MAKSIDMNDKQEVDAGVTILDKDGQPFDVLPTGATVSFTSDNESVATFTVGPDGMNGVVNSGKVGKAVITASGTDADGTALSSDTLTVNVTNSVPGSLNFTVGAPRDEATV